MEIPKNWTFKSKDIAEGFDSHVIEQLPWYPMVHSFVCHLVLCYLGQKGTLIDAGCSTGQLTRSLKQDLIEREINCLSIDNSEEMIKLFNGYGKAIAADITISDMIPSFDVCVMFLTLMFLDVKKRKSVLINLISRAESGGAIILIDKIENPAGYFGTCLHRMTMRTKIENHCDHAEIIEKELSLCGLQRPIEEEILLNYGFKKWLQIGEFSGYIFIKP